jgi:hypothetical protein
MFTERVSSHVLAVVDHNGGTVGFITKSVNLYFARRVTDRLGTAYASEAEAAEHFGFSVTEIAFAAFVDEQIAVGVFRSVAVVACPVCAVVALFVCMNAQAAHFGARAAAMLAGI